MSATSRAFSKEGPIDVETVAAALDPKFTVAAGTAHSASHTWLDTFDWRLHAAGISLRYADDGSMILQLPDGGRLQAPPARVKWPVQARELPAGPIRSALIPLTEPRALLPVVTVISAAQETRVLDGEQKTVARLLTESVADGASQLRIQPLRGYDSAADKIAELLARVDGFSAITTTPYEVALTQADRRPTNGLGSVTAVQPETLAVVAIAEVLKQFATAVEENVPGAIASIDTEFLHDLRVAVRRTRSILKLVGDVLPVDLVGGYAADFKWVGGLTTPVRDLDVYLRELDSMSARLTSAAPDDLDPFRSFLVKHRAAERRKLVRGLRSTRFQSLLGDWRAELMELTDGVKDGPSVAEVARDRLSKAYRKAARLGKRITADSPGDDVHALRKRCKELRYLLEVFKPICDGASHQALLKELKSLQDTLGDFQDGEVQREAVREFAAAMLEQGAAPVQTYLAMGEMVAQLDAHQLNARAVLADRLQPFLSRENRARVKALVP
jgi:CHAD domain-containing protein